MHYLWPVNVKHCIPLTTLGTRGTGRFRSPVPNKDHWRHLKPNKCYANQQWTDRRAMQENREPATTSSTTTSNPAFPWRIHWADGVDLSQSRSEYLIKISCPLADGPQAVGRLKPKQTYNTGAVKGKAIIVENALRTSLEANHRRETRGRRRPQRLGRAPRKFKS